MIPSFSRYPLFYLFILLVGATGCNYLKSEETKTKVDLVISTATQKQIDTIDYNKRMLQLSNHDSTGKWPVKTPYPLTGAILPYNRIVAYYGNLFSKRMGILGEIPKDEMLRKLQSEVKKWQDADSTTKAIPALHYIAVTAQLLPGKSGKYCMRMPFDQIDTIIKWTKSINALVFLDIQVGHSNIREEIASLEHFLRLPNVHLGIDPEFSLKNGEVPGTKIGSFNSEDINDAVESLSDLVKKYDLSPKVLVVHRFTKGMVTNCKSIKTIPEVQLVMNMDGFGDKPYKRFSYDKYIYADPVQFAGFKLFYKNDNDKSSDIFTPEEILGFTPIPIYIQYQ